MNRERRIQKLRHLLIDLQADLFITSRELDIYYFTGNNCEGVYIASHDEEYLFTDDRYIGGIEQRENLKVESVKSVDDVLKETGLKWKGQKAAVPYNERFSFVNKVRKTGLKVKPADVDSIRAIKDEEEIKLIKKAYQIIERAIMNVIPVIKEGVREKDLEAELAYQIRKFGADGESFPPIIAFGENSAIPHARTGLRRLKKGDVILIDAGCRVDGYCSDITRCFVLGNPSEDVELYYSYLYTAFQKALDKLQKKPVYFRSIDRAARRYLESRGLGENFTHSLGHGIGLMVHEKPYLSARSKDKIQSGMVFTIEPGVYFTNKFGLRLENAVYLADNPEVITKFSQNLIVL